MDFIFIHIPKCGGTFIYNQLPKEYNNKYFNQYLINEINEKRKKELLNFDNSNIDNWPKLSIMKYKYHKQINYDYLKEYNYICLDHLSVNDMINCHIINESDLNKEIIVFWRNPIDRFLSICNWFKITPEELIKRLKNPSIDLHTKITLGRNTWYQSISDIIKYKNKKIKTTNILLDNFDTIQKTFKKYNIDIKNISANSSKKIITRNNLNKQQIDFMNVFYKEDFIIYNDLKYLSNI